MGQKGAIITEIAPQTPKTTKTRIQMLLHTPLHIPHTEFQITSTLMQNWTTRTTTGDAADFHARRTDDVDQPELWIHEVERPTLVLGSTQSDEILDTERAAVDNIEVCKRRSGGGLVRVNPGELWVDLLLPRQSELWNPDVGASMLWVGEAWARALNDLLPNIKPTVYSGPLLNRDIGKVICFGGMGSGEVEVDGYKVVGISQRRTRDIARFQCLVKQTWDADHLRRYLADGNDAGIPWDQLQVGFPQRLQPLRLNNEQLTESLIGHLPNP